MRISRLKTADPKWHQNAGNSVLVVELKKIPEFSGRARPPYPFPNACSGTVKWLNSLHIASCSIDNYPILGRGHSQRSSKYVCQEAFKKDETWYSSIKRTAVLRQLNGWTCPLPTGNYLSDCVPIRDRGATLRLGGSLVTHIGEQKTIFLINSLWF